VVWKSKTSRLGLKKKTSKVVIPFCVSSESHFILPHSKFLKQDFSFQKLCSLNEESGKGERMDNYVLLLVPLSTLFLTKLTGERQAGQREEVSVFYDILFPQEYATQAQ